MIGTIPFFKKPDYIGNIHDMRMGRNRNPPTIMPIVDAKPFPGGNRSYYTGRGPIETMPINPHQGVRPIIGHPRYGFHTMLNQDSVKPLPTAPAIVGGNVDWTQAKVTPLTMKLHDSLSMMRPMNNVPTVGNVLNFREPSRDSIHTY